MKCKIPEISWHNRDPVLSVDIQPKSNSNYYRLASSGTDAHVLIWYMKLTSSGEYGDIELDLAADLTRHQRAVNVVKWSPSGELLASGDDESVIFIWKQKTDSETINILEVTNEQDKEVWLTLKVLRGHMEDIYDLSWAPNSLYLVSGSVDNSAMIWDVQKGKSVAILKDHKGFVQGVAWDPKNQYIATLSTDRYMRIFDIQTKKVLHRVSKSNLPVPEDNNMHGKRVRLFHDDTLQTFFRRLSFTPDGKLLLTPAGVTDYDGCTRPLNTTYIFSRYAYRQPAIVLPCPDQYTVAVKCCPLLYELRPFNAEKNPPVVPLPYRMVFAVATKSSVYFYDTQQKQPFALISNIHYTRLTDITWSNDGRIVVVSSTDGFCSLITFEKGELGKEYENSDAMLQAALVQVTKKPKKQKDNESSAKSRKSSTDDTITTQKGAAVIKDAQIEKIVEEQQRSSPTVISGKSSDQDKTKPVSEEENASLKGVKKLNEEKEILSIEIKQPLKDTKTIQVPVERKSVLADTEIKPGHINNETEEKYISMATCKTSEEEKTPPKKAIIMPSKVLATEIILDKEILSSDEKFESPEKKSVTVTPISVRRHPRTPKSLSQTPTSMSNILKSQVEPNNRSPISSLPQENSTTFSDKRAKPIAVRRTPRAIISTHSAVNATSLVEEAMDAWPLDKLHTGDTIKETSEPNKKPVEEAGIPPLPLSETSCERTEDIHLVYEETNEEVPAKEILPKISETNASAQKLSTDTPKPTTPCGNKTPRRVALKTISTPKSKKKLLD